MARRLNRITPKLPVGAFRTYSVIRPPASHFRAATCEEAGCIPHHHGWRSTVDESTDLGQAQAYYIRHDSGRRYLEERNELGLTEFTFAAGQRCFASDEHKVPVERPALYVVRDGDWRGNPSGRRRVHRHARDWLDDFGENQDRLADRRARG